MATKMDGEYRSVFLHDLGRSVGIGDDVIYHSLQGNVLAQIRRVRTDNSLDLIFQIITKKGKSGILSTFAVPRGEGPGTWEPEE